MNQLESQPAEGSSVHSLYTLKAGNQWRLAANDPASPPLGECIDSVLDRALLLHSMKLFALVGQEKETVLPFSKTRVRIAT